MPPALEWALHGVLGSGCNEMPILVCTPFRLT